MQKTIIVPLPNKDFDPSEVAIPWKLLTKAGCKVEFATVDGSQAQPDQLMLTGEGLDPWGWIPGIKKIKLLGLSLRANRDARRAFEALVETKSYREPLVLDEIESKNYDGLLLAGGHAPGMRPHLENSILHRFTADFFEDMDEHGNHKPVAAICHGVLIAARATFTGTSKSILFNKKVTALTWDLERSAWRLTKYYGRFWDPTYYRTYIETAGQPIGYSSTEHEIRRNLENDANFLHVPKDSNHFFKKTSGLFRDDENSDEAAWVVQDGNFISARWPGDVHTFTIKFMEALKGWGLSESE